jgi:hypothetical protein
MLEFICYNIYNFSSYRVFLFHIMPQLQNDSVAQNNILSDSNKLECI